LSGDHPEPRYYDGRLRARIRGETAAILNLDLRSGPIHPIHSFTLEGGGFSTFDGSLTLGGQFGKPIGAPQADGSVARRFGYLLDFTARRTQNALEPPQPGDQTAHNTGSSISGFGNFDYSAGAHDHFTLTLNTTPAYTQIANRTGLPANYAPVGQGYGFNGARNADGTIAGGDPTLLGGGTIPLLSQQAAGQDINQRDGSDFGVLNWRHTFNTNLTGLLSLGLVHSSQEIKNNNPLVDPSNLPSMPPSNTIRRSFATPTMSNRRQPDLLHREAHLQRRPDRR